MFDNVERRFYLMQDDFAQYEIAAQLSLYNQRTSLEMFGAASDSYRFSIDTQVAPSFRNGDMILKARITAVAIDDALPVMVLLSAEDPNHDGLRYNMLLRKRPRTPRSATEWDLDETIVLTHINALTFGIDVERKVVDLSLPGWIEDDDAGIFSDLPLLMRLSLFEPQPADA